MAPFMQANTHREERHRMSTTNIRPLASITQRRSQRILLSVPLLVTGKRSKESNFSERTTTIVVNAHGALLLLHETVSIGQILKLKNVVTTEEIVCKVVDINIGNNGVPEVGIEFAESCPRF